LWRKNKIRLPKDGNEIITGGKNCYQQQFKLRVPSFSTNTIKGKGIKIRDGRGDQPGKKKERILRRKGSCWEERSKFR